MTCARPAVAPPPRLVPRSAGRGPPARRQPGVGSLAGCGVAGEQRCDGRGSHYRHEQQGGVQRASQAGHAAGTYARAGCDAMVRWPKYRVI